MRALGLLALANAGALRGAPVHASLVELVLAGPDALGDVKSMIGGMLTRLQSADAADTTRSSWCAKELPKAAADLEQRKEDADARGAETDKLQAQLAELALQPAATEEHERRNQETQRVELNHQKVLDEQDARLA